MASRRRRPACSLAGHLNLEQIISMLCIMLIRYGLHIEFCILHISSSIFHFSDVQVLHAECGGCDIGVAVVPASNDLRPDQLGQLFRGLASGLVHLGIHGVSLVTINS